MPMMPSSTDQLNPSSPQLTPPYLHCQNYIINTGGKLNFYKLLQTGPTSKDTNQDVVPRQINASVIISNTCKPRVYVQVTEPSSVVNNFEEVL